jgi:2-polyprenyl-6-methoxyphenol hydroxylase-like FAD-dependent oxidoreductase
VGLCRLAGGEVNICGLFRSRTTVPNLAQAWREWLRGPSDSALHARLSSAEFDEGSFCSVAGLSLRQQRAARLNECAIGDALTMIPPVTGNGMSMAFESAELAIEPLAEFSADAISWEEARRRIAVACDSRFARRLALAGVLQRALFTPWLRPALFHLASRSGRVWRVLFEGTR